MSKKVVIVGGGIIGLATAWFCRKHGFDVQIVERKPQHRDGCSFGNAGMLVPSHIIPLAAPGMIRLGLKWMWDPESPFYIRPRASMDLLQWMWQFQKSCTKQHVEKSAPLLREMHFRSRELYQQLESELPEGFGLETRGLLMLCKSSKGLDEEADVAKVANQHGVEAQVLDSVATAKLDPAIEMDVHGSVFYPNDCHLNPNRLMGNMESSLENQGCKFNWDTESIGFTKSRGRIEALVTNRGEIIGDEFLLCGGIWSSALAKDLGLGLPMQAGKGYSVTLEKPTQLPQLCSLLHEARVAITPIGSSLRVGGTMEMSGVDESVTKSRVKGIIQSVPKYFPAFQTTDFAGLEAWSGLRPCSPDGLPYIGRSRRWSNLIVSTGHAMMGISLAMSSAEIAAQICAGENDQSRWKMLSPDRYSR